MHRFARRMLMTGLGVFLIVALGLLMPINNLSPKFIGTSLSPSPALAQTATGGTIFRREGSVWRSFVGQAAFSVAIGGGNNTWIIGNNSVPGGFGIYRWNGSGWQGIDGGAVDIAVAPNGQPWVVNNQGYIFRRVNGAWQVMPGRARDIDIGRDGSVWIIGTNTVPGGYGIYRWNGSGWQPIDGGAVRIAVNPNGQPWVVNNQGYIFRRVNGAWQHLTGLAKDIAIGHNGSVWVIGANAVPGGFGIYRWNGSGWQPIDGGAVRIAVDNNGNPWVINNISPPPSLPNPGYTYRDVDYLNTLYRDNVGNQFSRKVHGTTSAFDSVDGDSDKRVYALVGGEVIEAKNGRFVAADRNGNKPLSAWGHNGTIAIYNRDINKTFIYWHFAEGSINESLKSRQIAPGTVIGLEGNTGLSYGAHTHVEVHEGRANVNMSDPNRPIAPANSGRLRVDLIFQEAVRRGLVILYR